MDSLIKASIEQGGLFAIMVLGLYFLSRIGWWMAHRLLAPPDKTNGDSGGLLVQYFSAHQEFLSGLEKRDELHGISCRAHIKVLQDVDAKIAAGNRHIEHTAQSMVLLDHTIIDLAKARLLELSLHENMPQDEVARIKQDIENIFIAVKIRHQELLRKQQMMN